IPCSTAWH
ncbi:hypothetical protein EAI_05713, partial [Harpegnathos saltator]